MTKIIASNILHENCDEHDGPAFLVFMYHVDLSDVLLYCSVCGLSWTNPGEASNNELAIPNLELGDLTKYVVATMEQVVAKGWYNITLTVSPPKWYDPKIMIGDA